MLPSHIDDSLSKVKKQTNVGFVCSPTRAQWGRSWVAVLSPGLARCRACDRPAEDVCLTASHAVSGDGTPFRTQRSRLTEVRSVHLSFFLSLLFFPLQ